MFLGLDSTVISIIERLGSKGSAIKKEVYFIKE